MITNSDKLLSVTNDFRVLLNERLMYNFKYLILKKKLLF